MSITVSSFDFEKFVENPSTEYLLEWAIDLFWLATGIDELPEDPREARLVERAVFQMAWWLEEDHKNREAHMSGFAAERIGAYSYSIAQKSVRDGVSLNIPAWDSALEYFNNKIGVGATYSTSEHVFHQGYNPDKPWW